MPLHWPKKPDQLSAPMQSLGEAKGTRGSRRLLSAQALRGDTEPCPGRGTGELYASPQFSDTVRPLHCPSLPSPFSIPHIHSAGVASGQRHSCTLFVATPPHPVCEVAALPPGHAQLRAWLQGPHMNPAAVTKAERTKCTGGLLSMTFFELKYNSHTTIHPSYLMSEIW